ncbi:hypothetical protein VOLCADRAFT_94318 [Volvox carteri f. nagariensis]|uniref:Uncharacterized protein n=1 Tax=Volvox carteri f. nagariensis TaxID=3068 RepID=D8U466_VOLCA|nr:uncharacterized protein VOLCADRAFT_94318 [Volvox carteri f. nagariensis]EFJ45446.1 hypothetical protein VOLCADRAFT_94318 [Volvox carteri f. nagariensis]|eukprot:XP_002953473.1 hypothetical protein VOLCADRAFT_94318 [Volvox carteri f. nagariensis]
MDLIRNKRYASAQPEQDRERLLKAAGSAPPPTTATSSSPSRTSLILNRVQALHARAAAMHSPALAFAAASSEAAASAPLPGPLLLCDSPPGSPLMMPHTDRTTDFATATTGTPSHSPNLARDNSDGLGGGRGEQLRQGSSQKPPSAVLSSSSAAPLGGGDGNGADAPCSADAGGVNAAVPGGTAGGRLAWPLENGCGSGGNPDVGGSGGGLLLSVSSLPQPPNPFGITALSPSSPRDRPGSGFGSGPPDSSRRSSHAAEGGSPPPNTSSRSATFLTIFNQLANGNHHPNNPSYNKSNPNPVHHITLSPQLEGRTAAPMGVARLRSPGTGSGTGGVGGGGAIAAVAAATSPSTLYEIVPDHHSWPAAAAAAVPLGSRVSRAIAGILPSGNPGTFNLRMEERIDKQVPSVLMSRWSPCLLVPPGAAAGAAAGAALQVLNEGQAAKATPRTKSPSPAPPNPTVIKMLHSLSYLASKEACRTLAAGSRPEGRYGSESGSRAATTRQFGFTSSSSPSTAAARMMRQQ